MKILTDTELDAMVAKFAEYRGCGGPFGNVVHAIGELRQRRSIPASPVSPLKEDEPMTPQVHFDELRRMWLEMFTHMRVYLQNLDGDTSRAVGEIVYDLVQTGSEHDDWVDTQTARFIHGDTELWHEVANSRKA